MFDSSVGFVNNVEIQNGASYNEKFFGTYKDEYTVEIDNVVLNDGEEIEIVGGGKVGLENGVLTFKQTTIQQTVRVKITYSNLKAENKSREFTFIVLKGIHFDDYTNESQSGSGLVDTNVKLTTLNDDANVYSSPKGSKLDFHYDDSKGYYEYPQISNFVSVLIY